MPGHWMGVPLISVRILLDAGLSDADIARLLSCPLGTVVSCRCFYGTSERQSDPEPFLSVLDTSFASRSMIDARPVKSLAEASTLTASTRSLSIADSAAVVSSWPPAE